MGEIATWSAVKTKVGLGKDSNECPTKAELLALSPTGTGENYVGLEISNASSYGNNETVQLSDIHKVTYKYTFSQAISTLSFTALGGQSTNGGSIFNVISTKRKYLDGIATGSDIEVAYSSEDLPDWIIFQDNVFKALENTALSSRNYTRLSTQSESGKTLSGSFTQAAATQSWEYTLSHGVWNETDDLYTAIAGEYRTYLMDERSYKQEKRNGKNYGPQIPVPVTVSSDSTWLTLNPTTFDDIKAETLIQTFQENKTLSRRYATITFTQAESGKKFTAKRYQAAGVKTYGNITITPTGDVPDIPASGGASHTFPYTWTQPWGWNGKTNDGGTLTTGGTETWNASVSGSNLGTTAKARTKLGVRTVTVTCNGKSGTATKDVYQAENKVTNVTQGAWIVSISANPSTLTEMGGTSQISASARAPRTNTWSSGATNAASDATGTPTLSIPTASTGFSLSGTTLTVAENTTANQRSVVVRATMDTVYKEVTVTQSAYLVEWRYYLTTSTPTLNFDAIGATKSGTISSYREKYINGSLVEGSHEGVNIQVKSTSAEIQSATTAVAITMKENTTTQARTGTVVYEQVGSGKTVTITCNQAAGTVAIREELVIKESFPTAPNTGGTVKALVRSGYWDVVNGKDTTWHDDTPTVKTKPSFVSSTNVTYELGVGYRISATMPENTSESQLSGSLNLEYGSKTISLGVKQAGASVSSRLEIAFDTNQPDSWEAGPSGQQYKPLKVKCYRENIINGSVNSTTALQPVVTKSDWYPNFSQAIHVQLMAGSPKGTVWEYQVDLDDNEVESQKGGTIRFTHPEDETKFVEFEITQAAAVITYNYILSVSPSVLNFNAGFTTSIIDITSYREKIANGSVIDEENVTPNIGFLWDDPEQKNWLSYYGDDEANSSHVYTRYVECQENQKAATRSATIDIYQTDGKSDDIQVTQKAATISTRYEVFWNAVKSDGPAGERVTEVEIEGYVNTPESAVRLDLQALEYTTINGVEGAPVSLNTRPVGNGNSAKIVPNGEGELVAQVVNDVTEIDCTYIAVLNALSNLAEYPRTHTISLTNPKVVLNGKEIGQAPTVTVTVNPVPYTRVFNFGWKSEGSTISNITLAGDIYDSGSSDYRDIVSYVSLRRDGVEFAKKYIKPTFIPPSLDWLQVIDNGQNSDNTYNYAFKALTDNEGDSARNQQVRFEQPGNGNQSLYAYVSQDPRSEGYLMGEVKNLGPRSIQINTHKNGNFVDNTVVQNGYSFGMGNIGENAQTLEFNASVYGTDSSTYTQTVNYQKLMVGDRSAYISNEDENSDYTYTWTLYPSAGVPAGFDVKVFMLTTNTTGSKYDGIQLVITKKNTTVFPIGTLIGTLTLTPRNSGKLPTVTCQIYHRWFT